MDDADWPEFIDVYTGVFTYFGDNKKPGFDLHDTPRRGNRLLQSCFAILHNVPDQRVKVPPFLVFTKGSNAQNIVRGVSLRAAFVNRIDNEVRAVGSAENGNTLAIVRRLIVARSDAKHVRCPARCGLCSFRRATILPFSEPTTILSEQQCRYFAAHAWGSRRCCVGHGSAV